MIKNISIPNFWTCAQCCSNCFNDEIIDRKMYAFSFEFLKHEKRAQLCRCIVIIKQKMVRNYCSNSFVKSRKV